MDEDYIEHCTLTSIEALAAAIGTINPVTLQRIAKHPTFPRRPTGAQTYEYDLAECIQWLDANPGCFKGDRLKKFRVPEYQTTFNLKSGKVLNLEAEKAQYTKTQREIADVKLKKLIQEVVLKEQRDADEAERLEIFKRRLYEAASTAASELLLIKTFDEMAVATKELIVDKALIETVHEWEMINAGIDEIIEPQDNELSEELDEQEEELNEELGLDQKDNV